MPWTVEYFPPGREDVHVFSCKEKPEFFLNEEAQMHTLMLSFVPTNGASRGRRTVAPASCCLVADDA